MNSNSMYVKKIILKEFIFLVWIFLEYTLLTYNKIGEIRNKITQKILNTILHYWFKGKLFFP